MGIQTLDFAASSANFWASSSKIKSASTHARKPKQKTSQTVNHTHTQTSKPTTKRKQTNNQANKQSTKQPHTRTQIDKTENNKKRKLKMRNATTRNISHVQVVPRTNKHVYMAPGERGQIKRSPEPPFSRFHLPSSQGWPWQGRNS